ncbi:hypothetical protein Rumeso_00662 [Rubellimicrobium mesophilum DSM 19309]|uniref:Co-chaperone DjlA N-terminal domain-containing protein n=1 Tax=Rubellimicrobium mesophilum DSM 19309 TaxID=442562 RepID=A0A017HTM3_9RHOB|nr:hypothetical protein [Rubellimicrobium mesophilum]EYD77746.1 hypothetical protein Rumeso_00662 [Rubellimicrobium mesophilum DSM 19309]
MLTQDPLLEKHRREEALSATIAQIMALASGEQGDPSPTLAEGIRTTVQGLIGVEMSPDAISQATRAAGDPGRVLSNATEQATYLTERGKDLVLRAAIAAASAGTMDASRRETLAEIGKRLGMMPAHVNGVLAEVA